MTHAPHSILLVEDDADDQYFITRAFQEIALPTRLEAVNDGQSAVEFLGRAWEDKLAKGSARPDIVLLDLNLPRKSGLDVLKWIRSNGGFSSLVVIVLTSSTSDDDMREAYARGANAYVIKPADPSKLSQFAQVVRDFWFSWNQLPRLAN